MTWKEMLENRQAAYKAQQDLLNRAKAENRALNADEEQQWDKAETDFAKWDTLMKKDEELRNRESRAEAPPKEARMTPEYKDVFEKYVRKGMRSLDDEERALLQEHRGTDPQTTVAAEGGYTVPRGFSNELEIAMKEYGGMLQAARLLNTASGNIIDWPTVDDTAAVGVLQGAEGTAIAVNDMVFGTVPYTAYTIGTLVQTSVQLLTDTGVPLQAAVGDLLAERLGRIFNAYFTTGTGSSQPTGILAATNGSAKGADAGATALTRDNLLDLIHSVDPAYRRSPSATLMMNDATLKYLRKLVIGASDDRPLWQPSMIQGEPATIEGFRYIINQDMPNIGTTNKSVAFGDFSKYIIRTVGGITLRRLDERYAERLLVGFLAWQRADGRLLSTTAVKHLLHG
jgi:HK97 family phage major capsid protein